MELSFETDIDSFKVKSLEIKQFVILEKCSYLFYSRDCIYRRSHLLNLKSVTFDGKERYEKLKSLSSTILLIFLVLIF